AICYASPLPILVIDLAQIAKGPRREWQGMEPRAPEIQNATFTPARPLTTELESEKRIYSMEPNRLVRPERHSTPAPPKPPITLSLPGVANGISCPNSVAS